MPEIIFRRRLQRCAQCESCADTRRAAGVAAKTGQSGSPKLCAKNVDSKDTLCRTIAALVCSMHLNVHIEWRESRKIRWAGRARAQNRTSSTLGRCGLENAAPSCLPCRTHPSCTSETSSNCLGDSQAQMRRPATRSWQLCAPWSCEHRANEKDAPVSHANHAHKHNSRRQNCFNTSK